MPTDLWNGVALDPLSFTVRWTDGDDHTWASVPGNNERVLGFTTDYDVRTLKIHWHYGGAFQADGNPGPVSGAAGSFAIDIGPTVSGPWTEILADSNPVGTAGVSYPTDFANTYDLGATQNIQFLRFRSRTAGNNDVYTIEAYAPTVANTADFSGTPLSGAAPLEVAFTDLSSGTPISWAWDFGDGETATTQNPSHTYALPGTYDVTLVATWSDGSDSETKVAYVVVGVPAEAWDIYDGADPNGPILVTLVNAFNRQFQDPLMGTGSGQFSLIKGDPEATEAFCKQGNIVKVRIPEVSEDYIFAFILETGDFELVSSDEEGGQVLTFGGRGILAYLDRAIMWNEAFTTGLDIANTWTEIWETDAVKKPSGAGFFASEPDYLYVIDQISRNVYKITQATGTATYIGGPLFSFQAAGFSADPDDATIAWALEAPWLTGSGVQTKIHKLDRTSDFAVLATFSIGTNHFAGIRSDGDDLWLPNQSDNKVYRKSQVDGSTIASYGPFTDPSTGATLTIPTGVSFNDANQELAYWFYQKKFALVASLSDPGTITRTISTQDISAFGGDWTTEGGNEFFYMVSVALSRIWKYQLTTATPHDPVDGVWRLDEGTPGAILTRVIVEAQAEARPQQPLADLSYTFAYGFDSNGNAWSTHDGTLEFTARIGESVLDVVLRLMRYGVFLRMSPYLILRAYNTIGTNRASGTFASGKARFVAGINIAEGLRRQKVSRLLASHMLAEGDGGLYATAEQDDLGYVHEGFMSTQLTDATALAGAADAELDKERAVSEALTFLPDGWDSDHDVLAGKYLPYVDYSHGDTIRVHSGAEEFDYTEQNFTIYTITLKELDNGEWQTTVDIAEGIDASQLGAGGSSGGGSSGGTIGGGTGGGSVGGEPSGTSSTSITVTDTVEDVSVIARELQSDDWGLIEVSDRVARILMRWPELGRLANVNDLGITDGQGLVWDQTTEQYIPGTGNVDTPVDHGNMGATETLDLADGTWHRGTLTADCTITVQGWTVDQAVVAIFKVTQDGTGSWAITWDVDVVFTGDDQPSQAAGDVTWFLLWSDEGDSVIYGAKIGIGGLTVSDEGTPLAGTAEELDFVGAGVAASGTGTTKTITISGAPTGAAGGDLSGTYPNPSVVDDSHSHTSATAPGGGGPILITDTPAGSPLVFADLLQNEAGTDLLYADSW